MIGQFLLNGPYLVVKNASGEISGVKFNPHTWAKVANIIYFDQPTGVGKELHKINVWADARDM